MNERLRQFGALGKHDPRRSSLSAGVPAVNEVRHGAFDTVKARDFSASVGRIGLDLMLKLIKRPQQKIALEKELKAAKAAPVLKGM